ncbi:hypothetical protein ACFQ2B_27925 [Streptomyces stramineus]
MSVDSVKLDGTLLVEGTDYEWSESGILRRLGCQYWPARLGCLEAVYGHGWAEIPDDVAEVVIDQARSLYTVVPGVQSKAVGGQSVTFGAQAAVGVTSQWSAAVARHKVRTGSDV